MLSANDIINAMNICVFSKDKRSKYIYCNEIYAKLLDLDSPAQIVGKSDQDYFLPDSANVCVTGDSAVMNGTTLFNVPEIITPVCTRKSINIHTNKSQIRTNNCFIGVVGFFTEVTNNSFTLPLELLQYDANKKVYPFKVGNQNQYFTKREYEVFQKLFLGYSSKQIAMHLSISYRTAEDYIEKIKKKLQCSYKHNIVETAIQPDIIKRSC